MKTNSQIIKETGDSIIDLKYKCKLALTKYQEMMLKKALSIKDAEIRKMINDKIAQRKKEAKIFKKEILNINSERIFEYERDVLESVLKELFNSSSEEVKA